jgi:HK97 family phage major capsid protein
MRDVINGVIANRTEARGKLDALLAKAKDEKRTLSDPEKEEFDKTEGEIRAFDARIEELDAQIRSDEKASEVAKRYASGITVTSEPEVYRRGTGQRSYFKDLHLARNKGDRDALDRLQRNDRMRTEAEKRALTTTNGAGGEFVPPQWLENEFVRLARPGRITANLTPTFDLPAGTDSLNIPKVNTGTAVAQQTSQNTGVQQTDLTTGSISSPVVTIAGGQTISLQLLEQSPLNIDELILGDLASAYAVSLNAQVLAAAGGAGNLTGLTKLSGTNAITYTSASPTVALLYSKVANAIQTIHTSRFLPPDVIIMHPRRWAYLIAASDGQNRPLVTPRAQVPMNALAAMGEVASQGYVGEMQGLPVYVDPGITITNGAGTEDIIIVARMADLMLWESTVRAEAFQQTFAQNLSVFVRLYNYASFQAGRYPQSISIVSGTGLIAPTF